MSQRTLILSLLKEVLEGRGCDLCGLGGPRWTCGPWGGHAGSSGAGLALVCEGEGSLGVSCPALGRWPHSAHPFQWVLAFEIFIPLVLFFILLGLRQKKPTISVKEGEGLLGAQTGGAGRRPSRSLAHPCVCTRLLPAQGCRSPAAVPRPVLGRAGETVALGLTVSSVLFCPPLPTLHGVYPPPGPACSL